ncbi:MAG: pyridoxal-phosphate dependent enzyme [Cytophagales bacterium]|nr:pyridoxal-phosphate dependent enzyme [Cytophagales bacterium]
MYNIINNVFTNISPEQRVCGHEGDRRGIELMVKRDDLIHTHISGNKWRKLKYNLLHTVANDYDTILTFGGAYSNHIYATACAGNMFNINTIGIIRGDDPDIENTTLAYAASQGMKLDFVSREYYKLKNEARVLKDLAQKYGTFWLIPEGGCNAEGMKGCQEMWSEIDTSYYTHVIVPCGTGATMAGLIAAAPDAVNVIGISVLKGGFMKAAVRNLLNTYFHTQHESWEVIENYHFGGYAKTNEMLNIFLEHFHNSNDFKIEHVYSGKMFFAIFEMIKSGYFPEGSRILAIHTGGLRGGG